jgi:hypothetical protein
MTLAHLEPGRMNSTKLFAFVLIALGLVAFAYHNLPDTNGQKGIGPATLPETAGKTGLVTPAIALGVIALAGGLVVLAIDRTEHAA